MKKTIAMISMMVVSGMTVASDYVVIVTENFNTISDVVTPPEPVETYIGLPKIQTGYTNEYGRVMASSEYNHHGDYYPANKVMNGLNTNDHLTNWLAEYNVITNQWTGFEFNEPRKVKEFLV